MVRIRKTLESTDFVYLVSKRPEGGLLGGFWEFPSLDLPDSEDNEDSSTVTEVDTKSANEFLRTKFGVDVTSLEHLQRKSIGTYNHKFTHIDQTLFIEKLDITSPDPLPLKDDVPNVSWVSAEELSELAMSKTATVCLEMVNQKNGTPSKKVAKKTTTPAVKEKNQPSILSMFAKASTKK